eukprot:2617153-Rhodomonas_salina.1
MAQPSNCDRGSRARYVAAVHARVDTGSHVRDPGPHGPRPSPGLPLILVIVFVIPGTHGVTVAAGPGVFPRYSA